MRSIRPPSSTNRPSPRRSRRSFRADSTPSARAASPLGSVIHSATRTTESWRPSAESPGDTSTSRADGADSEIRCPSSRSIDARVSSVLPPSTMASTAGPRRTRSSTATGAPPSAGFSRNWATAASSRGRGVVLIGVLVVLVVEPDHLHGRAQPGALCGLDQRGAGLLERGEHRRLGLRGARHELVGLPTARLRGRQHLGSPGLGLGVAVGERLLEALTLLAQLLFEPCALLLRLALGVSDDVVGVAAGVVDVAASGLRGLVDQPPALRVDVLHLELARLADAPKLVAHDLVESGARGPPPPRPAPATPAPPARRTAPMRGAARTRARPARRAHRPVQPSGRAAARRCRRAGRRSSRGSGRPPRGCSRSASA